MASAELHIKDSFYFEVPKALWPSKRHAKGDFPTVWIKNDPQFQAWEADRLCAAIPKLNGAAGVDTAALKHDYEHWLHADHANFGKPLDIYLQEQTDLLHDKYVTWQAGGADRKATFSEWLSQPEQANESCLWFARASQDSAWVKAWKTACHEAGDVKAFIAAPIEWTPEKIDAYNFHLSGKLLIPQPFGELRNLYQGESGFCISKYMIVEALVFAILLVIFARVGKRVAAGGPPQGRFWNFFESMLVFVRDEIARKAIVSHEHHEEGHDDHGHGEHAHGEHGHADHAHGDHAHGDHGHAAPAHAHAHDGDVALAGGGALALHHAHNPYEDADRFTPLLWTIFFFILGCNLMGMLPWLGAPSSSWGATIALALVTFFTGLVSGSKKFGFLGYWANQVPSMGLPFVLAIILVPMIFLIEVLGLVIKHTVLSVRLLANMIAGHLVLLAILMLAFSVEGAASSSWGVTGFFAVVGSALLSLLELFVAFLQAYVFTLLSALFINAAIHKH